MSKQNDFTNIGQVYGNMLNKVKHTIVAEGKTSGTVKPGEIGNVPLEKGGPTQAKGFTPSKIDRKTLSKKEKENKYNIKNLSQPENTEEDEEDKKTSTTTKKRKISKESKKIVRESINNFMRKKSIFDKLYENVMNPGGGMPSMDTSNPGGDMGGEMDGSEELDALGIEGSEDTGEEVTFTLDRETAQTLIDVLQAAMGGEEEMGDEDGDYEPESEGSDMEEDEPEEAEEGFWDEDEESVGGNNLSKEINYGKNNKVGNLKTQSGGASSAYTDKVGADGDHGHALVNAKQPNMGKSNKVGSLKTGKSIFEQ